MAYKKEPDATSNHSGVLVLEKIHCKKRDILARRVKELEEFLKKIDGREARIPGGVVKILRRGAKARGLKSKLDDQLAQIEVLKEEAREAGRNEV